MAKLSITRRLIASLLVMQFALTISVVSIAIYSTRRQLRSSFDAALSGRAMSVAALVRFAEEEKGKLEFDTAAVPSPLHRDAPDIFKIVLSKTGELIATSESSAGALRPPSSDEQHWTAELAGREYRVVRLKDLPVLDKEGPDSGPPPTITVLYASSTEELHRRLLSMVITSSLGSLGLLCLAMAVTVWVVRSGLSPLAQLADSATRVTPDRWRLEAPERVRETEELVPLAVSMDQMLRSLEDAFNAQRDFIANAAHELKTPIAVLKSTLQLTLQRPRNAEEYRTQLESALEDVARLESLTYSMLRLARAERLHARDRSSLPQIDLRESCDNVAQRLRPFAMAKKIDISVQGPDARKIHAEPEDLEIIWGNLIENAIRYSAAGQTIQVEIQTIGDAAEVRVVDHGVGIGREDLSRIFERFHRADESRSRDTGGYGLGLAIVKAMVEAYGGSVRAESDRGSGTSIIIMFP